MRPQTTLKPIISLLIGSLLTWGCSSTPDQPETPTKPETNSLMPLDVKDNPDQGLMAVLLKVNRAQEGIAKLTLDLPREESWRKIKELKKFLRDITSPKLPQILETLKTGKDQPRRIAAFAAGWPRQPIAIQPLINALRDPAIAVVKNACLGLRELCLPEIPALPLIEVAETHPDIGCRSNAMLALANLARFPEKKEIKPVFLRALKNREARLRLHALKGLNQMMTAKDLPFVMPLLKDPIPLIRRLSVVVLGKAKSPEVIRSLIDIVGGKEPDENVRLYAKKVLQSLSGGQDAGYNAEGWRLVFAAELKAQK